MDDNVKGPLSSICILYFGTEGDFCAGHRKRKKAPMKSQKTVIFLEQELHLALKFLMSMAQKMCAKKRCEQCNYTEQKK